MSAHSDFTREGRDDLDSAIMAVRLGKMTVLLDDSGAFPEGSLFIAAMDADAAVVNFMARHGRGLVCLAITPERREQLNLPVMARRNDVATREMFTLSIEAAEGVSTGISAADRALTIKAACAAGATPAHLAQPGHIFPIVAKGGGVLERSGRAEAAVDMCSLAGRGDAGVVCTIMSDDGSLAGKDELAAFAREFNLNLWRTSELRAYRHHREGRLDRISETTVESRYAGTLRAVIYRHRINGSEHVALIKGKIDDCAPVPVHVHAVNLFDDIVGDVACPNSGVIQKALARFGDAGRGVVILLRETRPSSPSEAVAWRRTLVGATAAEGARIRNHDVAASILADLGVRALSPPAPGQESLQALVRHGLTIAPAMPQHNFTK